MKKLVVNSLVIFAVLLTINAKGQKIIQVNKGNAGQTIQINQDQVLEINLPRLASAGYIWREANTSSDKAIQQSITKIGDGDFIPDNKTLRGGTGIQIIRYVGASQGITTLSLELKRPWEKNKPALDNYTITVVSAGKYTGTYTPPVKAIAKYNRPSTTVSSISLPSQWDWRPQSTPCTDQGNCGDCYAFAAVGTFECVIEIVTGRVTDISEEWLTNCDSLYSDGCNNGGNDPLDMFLPPQGAVWELEDTWTVSEGNGTTGSCGGPYAYHDSITCHNYVPGASEMVVPTVASTKASIYNYGPIFTYVDASNWNWNDNAVPYIWSEVGSSNTDHCVMISGWKDTTVTDGSGGYWIIRNSWGTGWGRNGYIYLTYGTDFIGQGGNYIVYKNGISHALPPVADFGASATSSCRGAIQFTDSSINNPTSWHWNFGDGDTSNVQNPLHTYISNNTYTVSLKATNSYGNNTATKTSYVIINLPPSPTTTNGSAVSGGSVTLYASGTGTLDWYNAATGGTIVNTGISYVISPLTTNETYYVENDVPQAVQSAGMLAKTTNGSYSTSSSQQGLVFNVLAPLTIDSVMVYENAAGSRTVLLQDGMGDDIDSVVTTVATGTQWIKLNFNVPVGVGYTLNADGSNSFWRETSGAAYPYTVSNLISITGCTGSTTTRYYYFYNWQVQGASCTSARVPVTATITNGIKEFSESDMELFPNPTSGSFDITLNGNNYGDVTVSITNVLGEKLLEKKTSGNNTIHIDATSLQDGVYFVELKTEKGIAVKKIVKE